MKVFHVVQARTGWQVTSSFGLTELSSHSSKFAAIRFAQDNARAITPAQVVIHNEDGTIDFLEHGHGEPNTTPPEYLASSSGTRFPCVQESVSDLLMRGAEAVVNQPKNI